MAGVTVLIQSEDLGEGYISTGSSLVFTSENWNVSQVFTVTGVDDDSQDGSQLYDVTMSTIATDLGYDTFKDTIAISNLDNDVANIFMTSIDNETDEFGDSARFSFELTTEPSSSVDITISIGDTTEGEFSTDSYDTTITIQQMDWDILHYVSLFGVDDVLDDDDINYFVQATSSSIDANYNSFSDSLTIINIDNDTAAILVTMQDSLTSEFGAIEELTLVLTTQPSDTVLVALVPNITSEASVSSGNVIYFSPSNWNVPQTVTVTGVDDDYDDGDIAYIIDIVQNSEDEKYNNLSTISLGLTNLDNDTAGVTVDPLVLTVAEDGSELYTVVLDSKPTDDVVLTFSLVDSSYAEIYTDTLTITVGDWDIPISLDVSGLETYGLERYDTILIDVISNDLIYNHLSVDSVFVTVTPLNDAPSSVDTTVTMDEDIPFVFTSSDFTFTDVDGDSFTELYIETLPSLGLLWIDTGNGVYDIGEELEADTTLTVAQISQLYFSSEPNMSGSPYSTFTFNVGDGTELSLLSYTMTINVIPVADAPLAMNGTVTTDEDVSYHFTIDEFNYSDEDNDPISSVIVSLLPSDGVLWLDINGNRTMDVGEEITVLDEVDVLSVGKLCFTPETDMYASPYTYFLFNVSDGVDVSAELDTMFINVLPINDSPTSEDTTIILSEDVVYNFTASSFPFFDIDDSDQLDSVTIVSLPTNGVIWYDVNRNNLYELDEAISSGITLHIDSIVEFLYYEPLANSILSESFEFNVNDGELSSIEDYTFNINIDPTNDAAIAFDTTLVIYEDALLEFILDLFPSLDIDLGDTIEAIRVNSLASLLGGELLLNGDTLGDDDVIAASDIQNVTFNGIPDWNGPAFGEVNAFEFEIFDGDMYSNVVNFNIIIIPVNDAPVITNIGDTITYIEDDSAVLITTTALLSDVDDTHLDSLFVKISNSVSSEDTLIYTGPSSIDAFWDSYTQTLILSGIDTLANYQDAIRNVSYLNTNNENPSTIDRELLIWASDGDLQSDTVSQTIKLSADDDDIIWLIKDNSVIEGDSGVVAIDFTIQVSEDLVNDQTIDYYVDLYSAEASDLDSGSLVTPALPYSATILAGQDSVVVSLYVLGDRIVEHATEEFRVVLVNPSEGSIITSGRIADMEGEYARGYIINDDKAYLSITNNTMEEGDVSSSIIELNNFVEGGFSLVYIFEDSTALVDLDYIGGEHVITFVGDSAEQQTASINTIEDSLVEYTEYYNIILDSLFDYFADSTSIIFSDNIGQVELLDNDSAHVEVTLIVGPSTSEDSTMVTFSVVLTSQPTSDVILNSSSDDLTEGFVSSGTSLVFTPDNWYMPQYLIVTGVDDNQQDGTIYYDILLNTQTLDINYVNKRDTLELYNIDDDVAGLILTVVDNESIEDGDSAKVFLQLTTEPLADVDVSVILRDSTEGQFSLSVIDTAFTITAASWDEIQCIYIEGVDDQIDDDDIYYYLDVSTSSTDELYNSFVDSTLITNIDNDSAMVTVVILGDTLTSEDGDEESISIVLGTEPTDTVFFDLVSSDPTEGDSISVTPIVFTPENWNVPQIVDIIGIDDNYDDGDIDYSIEIVSRSDDDNYNNYPLDDITLTNIDNDEANIIVTPTNLTIAESGTGHFNIRLDSEPIGPVVIDISLADSTYAEIFVGTITIEPAYWNLENSFSILGLETYGVERYDTVLFVVSSADALYDNFDTDSVFVIIGPVNDAPISSNDTVIGLEDEVLEFTSSDFTFEDIDNDAFSSLLILDSPSMGTLWIDSNGNSTLDSGEVIGSSIATIAFDDIDALRYTPLDDAHGLPNPEFHFAVSDGLVNSDSSYIMTIVIEAVNDAPTSADTTVVIDEDTSYDFADTTFPFTDVDGDELDSVMFTVVPADGILWYDVDGDGEYDLGEAVDVNTVLHIDSIAEYLFFTPSVDGNGLDSLIFTVNDSLLYSDEAYTLYFDVVAVNDPPTSTDTTIIITEDTPYDFADTDFPFSDIDGDDLDSVSFTNVPADGILWYDADGDGEYDEGEAIDAGTILHIDSISDHLFFIPGENSTGIDSLTFIVNDGSTDSDEAYTLFFDVLPVNDAPTSADTTVVANEWQAYNLTDTDFPFSDVDGDSLESITFVEMPINGTLWYDTNGDGVYDVGEEISAGTALHIDSIASHVYFISDLAANGLDSLTFLVNDGQLDSDSTYTFFIDVLPVNYPPVSADTALVMGEDSAFDFAGDEFPFVDSDGDALDSITFVTLPSDGVLWYDADGDGEYDEGEELTDGTSLHIDSIVEYLFFTPSANSNGLDSLSFTVSDGLLDSESDYTLYFDVIPVNDAPVSAGVSISIQDSVTYQFQDANFSFTDVDGDSLVSITLVTLPVDGILWFDADGDGVYDVGEEITNSDFTIQEADIALLNYIPEVGNSEVSFDFQVSDGSDLSEVYTFIIEGEETNVLPFIDDVDLNINQGDTLTFSLGDFENTVSYDDANGDALDAIMIVSLPSDGMLVFNGVEVELAGLIIPADSISYLQFIPVDIYWNGELDFEWDASDGTGFSGIPALVTIVVNEGPIYHFMPEVFTPNDDGSNDVFYLPWLHVYNKVKLEVFNRWGSLVYRESDYQNDFAGYANVDNTIGSSNQLPVGTYYYIIEIEDTGERFSSYVYLTR